ncbi:MAG: hypothetical protein VX589_16115 [Myxococcota bacterium]|nr:hypothetical protein [Myxococcota bacterium]
MYFDLILDCWSKALDFTHFPFVQGATALFSRTSRAAFWCSLCIGFLSLFPMPSRADEPVSVLVVASGPMSSDADELTWQLREVLRLDTELTPTLVAPFLDDRDSLNLSMLNKGLRHAKNAQQALDYATAVKRYEAVLMPLLVVTNDLKTVVAGLSRLAWLYSALGKATRARRVFEQILNLEPTFTPMGEEVSPTVSRIFNEAKGPIDRAQTGRLSVNVAGQTPVAVFVNETLHAIRNRQTMTLPVGTHTIRINADGFVPRIFTPNIRENRETRLRIKLESTSQRQTYAELRAELDSSQSSDGVPEPVRVLASLVAARQTITIRLTEERVEAQLYDMQRNRFVRRIHVARRTVPNAEIARQIFEALYAGLNRRAPSTAHAVLPVESTNESLTSAWWFWPTIGAGIALAIIIPTALMLTNDESSGPASGSGPVLVEF